MVSAFLNLFFGCCHKRYSFPITPKAGPRRGAAALTGTYVVCLDCGKEFPYDWEEMRIVTRVKETAGGIAVESYANK